MQMMGMQMERRTGMRVKTEMEGWMQEHYSRWNTVVNGNGKST